MYNSIYFRSSYDRIENEYLKTWLQCLPVDLRVICIPLSLLYTIPLTFEFFIIILLHIDGLQIPFWLTITFVEDVFYK